MKYNLNKVVNNVLAGLKAPQKKVLERRYGLNGKPEATLAEIGEDFEVTRERIRQIEAAALKAIKQNLEQSEVRAFVRTVADNLKSVGGVKKEDRFLNDLGLANSANQVRFLLEVAKAARYYQDDKDFYSHWYLNGTDRQKALDYLNGLTNLLAASEESQTPKDAVNFNYVTISKRFTFNSYGDFGLSNNPLIKPQGSRDWAYLVLKKEGRPLHFLELAEKINHFREKNRTHFQTVHNELIKDDRFVLVGRGTYGLQEFGLIPGTAQEVMRHFLKKHGPLKSKDLIQLVQAERMFKENTLLFNLRDRKSFERLSDGRYTVREA